MYIDVSNIVAKQLKVYIASINSKGEAGSHRRKGMPDGTEFHMFWTTVNLVAGCLGHRHYVILM